jgi:hypothetical protein
MNQSLRNIYISGELVRKYKMKKKPERGLKVILCIFFIIIILIHSV